MKQNWVIPPIFVGLGVAFALGQYPQQLNPYQNSLQQFSNWFQRFSGQMMGGGPYPPSGSRPAGGGLPAGKKPRPEGGKGRPSPATTTTEAPASTEAVTSANRTQEEPGGQTEDPLIDIRFRSESDPVPGPYSAEGRFLDNRALVEDRDRWRQGMTQVEGVQRSVGIQLFPRGCCQQGSQQGFQQGSQQGSQQGFQQGSQQGFQIQGSQQGFQMQGAPGPGTFGGDRTGRLQNLGEFNNQQRGYQSQIPYTSGQPQGFQLQQQASYQLPRQQFFDRQGSLQGYPRDKPSSSFGIQTNPSLQQSSFGFQAVNPAGQQTPTNLQTGFPPVQGYPTMERPTPSLGFQPNFAVSQQGFTGYPKETPPTSAPSKPSNNSQNFVASAAKKVPMTPMRITSRASDVSGDIPSFEFKIMPMENGSNKEVSFEGMFKFMKRGEKTYVRFTSERGPGFGEPTRSGVVYGDLIGNILSMLRSFMGRMGGEEAVARMGSRSPPPGPKLNDIVWSK